MKRIFFLLKEDGKIVKQKLFYFNDFPASETDSRFNSESRLVMMTIRRLSKIVGWKRKILNKIFFLNSKCGKF